jgi:hypothetical protein
VVSAQQLLKHHRLLSDRKAVVSGGSPLQAGNVTKEATFFLGIVSESGWILGFNIRRCDQHLLSYALT